MSFPVSLSGVCKTCDSKKILDDITVFLRPGSINALLGPNGAGKTTLIGCLLGLLTPDSGSVQIWGEKADALSDSMRLRIGFVPQTMTGLTWFRVQELKDYLASFRNSKEDQEDRIWADWAALDPKARISTLSGGERQRLAIVLALRFSPDLIILDEPVASLDPAARRDFIDLLSRHVQRRETTALISSHIISDLERICDRFLFLQKGRLIGDLAADVFTREIRRLAVWPDTHLGLRIISDQPDGSVWVSGWRPELDTLDLPVLSGDMEAYFLALTR
ncbi:ABC transporter ATP-binding protein [Asaia prunellae]|uniref:ABC transporter ATP-binding protein n=1 Tax=Asaia prunellae TaxID=610245 RepID=UPI00046F3DD5|nr:ABC transporter ATP-binding protein [Asaia prunellae]